MIEGLKSHLRFFVPNLLLYGNAEIKSEFNLKLIQLFI